MDSGNAIVPTAYVNDAFSSNTVIADPELSLPKIKPEIGAYVSPAPSERATFANSRASTAGRTRARSRAPQAGQHSAWLVSVAISCGFIQHKRRTTPNFLRPNIDTRVQWTGAGAKRWRLRCSLPDFRYLTAQDDSTVPVLPQSTVLVRLSSLSRACPRLSAAGSELWQGKLFGQQKIVY